MALDQYFEPQKYETELYRRWEESGAFRADASSPKPAFTISMPPPNATGTLHLGHAVTMAVEDLMTRWRRMAGDEALWLPGTDHAAIATESVVIRKLQAEGMANPRHELGREGLLEKIREYVAGSRHRIREQIRAIGASCDWSRERYTMDPALHRCVDEVFARMFADGLIYRGPRIVNWDPHLQTTVSDDEIYHEDRPAKFYTLRYGPFLVATSRPETKLGDTAVAVHPEDERYREHVGKTYEVPWPKGPTITIRVVADEHVDPEFGTGCLGVTPAHSQADFEIAERHGLEMIQIIGEDGRMTEAAGPHYAGMTVLECREVFAAELEAAGLMEKVADYTQPISLCYRSKQPIEPLPKEQWFIDVNKEVVEWEGAKRSLRQILHDTVASGDIAILPQHQEKTYFHWVDNLRDWCISRQIWWGHRIPVWYRGDERQVSGSEPAGGGWTQDSDTLDTWFSSALWTWSTLVDPALAEDPELSLEEILTRSPDFQKFHPTSVMETGYDILFFWVARMILMTTYATGQIPFHKVYLHGLILDRDGDKMSKSKPETSIDPVESIEEHGADVLRLALVSGTAPGKDLKLTEERVTGCKRLINKLWNAAKLVDLTVGDRDRATLAATHLKPQDVAHPVNRWMLHRVRETVARVDGRFAESFFGDGAEILRNAFWSELCDFYLEAIKIPELKGSDETAAVLFKAYTTFLKLFHPFMPFVTEALWQELVGEGLLIQASWPEVHADHDFTTEAEGIDAVVRLLTAVRGIRAEQGLEPGAKIEVAVRTKSHPEIFAASAGIVERQVRAEKLVLTVDELDTEGAATAVDPAFDAAVRLGEADRSAERERLVKQLESERGRLGGVEKRLQNPQFVERAKPEVVEGAKKQAEELKATITAIEERLATLD